MARGIDAASHKGAMYALEQNGPTVAVLGTGADIVYPAENFSLYEQIAAQGAVISAPRRKAATFRAATA